MKLDCIAKNVPTQTGKARTSRIFADLRVKCPDDWLENPDFELNHIFLQDFF